MVMVPDCVLKTMIAASLAIVGATSLDGQYPQSLSIDLIVGRVVGIGDLTRDGEGRRRGAIDLGVKKSLKGERVRDRLELPVANRDDYYKGEFYPAKSNANVKSHRLSHCAVMRQGRLGS